MTPTPLALGESRAMIAAASLLVPGRHRAEWRREWNAEMWHAWHLLIERGESSGVAWRQLRRWSAGAFRDAAWYRMQGIDQEGLARRWAAFSRTPAFCLSVIALLLTVITLASGFLRVTRSVLEPLPWPDDGRIATIMEGGASLSMQSGTPIRWTRLWQNKSHMIQGSATYTWSTAVVGAKRALDAQVGPRFFAVLGVEPGAGRLDVRCAACAVLSFDSAVANYGAPASAIGRRVMINDRPFVISGVLPKGFWFLSHRIAAWTAADESDPFRKTGLMVRMAPDVTPQLVSHELLSIVRRRDPVIWDCVITVSPVGQRVRSALGSFALGLLLAAVIVLAGVRLRVPLFHRDRQSTGCRLGLFFVAKTAMMLLAVLLAGLEFTHAASITMLGGTDLATEPISTWLFLVGSMGALTWSIHDQRRRCRVCVRRLGLCAHVGCPGCLLLNWAGTEMVCIEGHGMLHVPEMISSWNEPERWTVLDESWQELFAPPA